jgi:SpoU rRNA methylase family enzyme
VKNGGKQWLIGHQVIHAQRVEEVAGVVSNVKTVEPLVAAMVTASMAVQIPAVKYAEKL